MNKRLGRLAAFLLSVALILSAFPLFSFVFAAPYTVNNAQDFKNYVVNKANDASVVINIGADFTIDSEIESDFAGTLNGNGHVITIGAQTALFKEVKNTAKIYDLGVMVAQDKPLKTPANSLEYRGVLANAINGTVSRCFTYGSINVTYNISNDSFVGGFCGSVMENANISNSFSCVDIVSNNTTYSGGFAGIVRSDATKGTPTITSCYSSGTINADSGFVAGFANVEDGALDKGTITDTYTSCQLVNLSNDALPSGVNGLYDNQLSLMRESLANPGQSTTDLMRKPTLSEAYTATSTTYPALKNFFDNMWSKQTLDVVEVSVAAAVFSDVTSGSRKEPSDVMTRADYLPLESYVDRTNNKNLSWTVEGCKVYDTVPVTLHNEDYIAGTGADLLRSKFVFTSNSASKKMTASKNGVSRSWYISAYSVNPYFKSGNGTSGSSYQISTVDQLNRVRFYSLITTAYYKVTADIPVGTFDPIVDFIGTFDGNSKVLIDFTPSDDRDGDIGLFANTRSGSSIKNVYLANVNAVTASDKKVGALIGSADSTTLNNIVVFGTNTISGTTVAGGVIGEAKNSNLTRLLVSVEIDAPKAGGIVGNLIGGKLTESGSTGLVGGNTAAVLGGLVGETSKGTSNAAISYSYSTATVLSKVPGAVCGGLVGKYNNASLKDSYSAALSAVKNESGVFKRAKPLVGVGTAGTGCSYDGQFYDNASNVISVSGSNDSNSKWKVTSTNYPQIAYFANKSSNANDVADDLSSVSTVLFYYQHYWEDVASDDSTTGFIPANFNKPTVATLFCTESDLNGDAYTVESTPGYGFEPASGVDFVVMRTEDTAKVGVRYATIIRDDLVTFQYSLTTVSGSTKATKTPVYLELSYSKDKTIWSNTQTFMLSASAAPIALYDIPKDCYVRVRVWTNDGAEVSGNIKANKNALTLSDGYYISSVTFAQNITLSITLKDVTEPWGVQREIY